MRRVIGLMSGTSLDGIDSCLARFWEEGARIRFELEAFSTFPFPPGLKDTLLQQMKPETSRVDYLCALDAELADCFASAALRLIEQSSLKAEDIDLIGSHGQTLYHRPQGTWPSTMQLGDGSMIAVKTGITTVSDFRPADMAAGGQGAPLIPAADRALFANPDRPIALLNLGGIANVTLLPPGGHGNLLAFDIGPANMVIDRFVERMTEGFASYDANGGIAARGQVWPELLESWLQHPFFEQKPPKSTGREEFGHNYADHLYDRGRSWGIGCDDLVATATALTAHSIARAMQQFAPSDLNPAELIVSGGGARNATLMRLLSDLLAPMTVSTIDAHGISSEAKEALAFALFAYQAANGMTNHAPDATGACETLILGKIAPGRNYRRVMLKPHFLVSDSTRLTESPNPRTQNLDQMSVEQILAVMNEEDSSLLDALSEAKESLATLISKTVEALRNGGRLFYVGAGTSGRLGVLDASECPPTFSSEPDMVQGLIAGGDYALRHAVEGAEDDRAAGAADLRDRTLASRDVVVGIAASGRTPYVHGALEFAKNEGAYTALLSCNHLAEPPSYVDALIELLVGPEVLTGSSRLKAGSVTKLALNMITTASMIRLGKVYRNRMVDVRPSNDKLKARALRMVQELAEIDAATAERLLAESQGKVKTAVVMAHRQVEAKEAERLLSEADGYLRQVIGDNTEPS